jgi:hypothetical protein
MQDKKVYVLLSNTGTLLNKSIKKYTKAPYNHASIAFDKELIELYSFGRIYPRNPLYGGFVQENIVKGTFSRYPETTCQVYEIDLTERQLQKMIRILNIFKKNRNYLGFNVVGLVGVAINKPIFTRKGAYFCSQFVSEVFVRSGLDLWEKKTSLVTPEDIRNTKEFKLIYEGKLREYPGTEL